MLYIAVVCHSWKRARNKHGHWASFICDSKEEAINRALKARAEWHLDPKCTEPYEIFVGQLTEEVVPPKPRPDVYDLQTI